MEDKSNLSLLLQSKSRGAQMVGWAAVLFLFLPTVFRVIGDEDLTVWQRLEQVSLAAGQTILSVSAVAIEPKMVFGQSEREDSDHV